MPRKDELDYISRAELLSDGIVAPSPQRGYFFSVIIALNFLIFGQELIVAQITTVIISTLAIFPSYFLAMELFRKKPYKRELAFATALLSSLAAFSYSYKVRNDQLFVLFFLIACYFLVKGLRERPLLKFAGMFAGLAHLTRDPGILIMPVFIIFLLLNLESNPSVSNRDSSSLSRLKLHLDRNFILMIGIYLCVFTPKLLLRWYAYGHPLYTLNSYSYFWIDQYADKYYYILTESRASMMTYLSTHTPMQLANRIVVGALIVIGRLQSHLTPPLFIMSLGGAIIFREKRYWILHINIGFWGLLFSWLFPIGRTVTRWMLPIFPFLIILGIATILEFLYLGGRYIRKNLNALISKSVGTPISGVLSFLKNGFTRIRRKFLFIFSSRKSISVVIVLISLSIFVPVFASRTQNELIENKPNSGYNTLLNMADWISNNTPEDAFFMSEQEDMIEYYAHRSAMFIPPWDIQSILRTILEERVDYLVIDSETLPSRSALTNIFEGNYLPQGFLLVYKNYEENETEGIETSNLKIQIYSTINFHQIISAV